jgi:hypothetical protein
MKYPIFSIISLSILLGACQNPQALNDQIAQLQQENFDLQVRFTEKGPDRGELVHTVFLQTKTGVSKVDRQMYLDEILKLNKLDFVHDLHVGVKADLKDERSITNHDAFFWMIFKNKNDYDKWQNEGEYFKIKKYLEPFLASEPVTYDYWVQ